MKEKTINRNMLLRYSRDAMTDYGMSVGTIERNLIYYRKLVSFMVQKGIINYTEDVGQQFLGYASLNNSYSIKTKESCVRVVSLLKLILNERPYTPRFTHVHKEHVLYGDIGEAAEDYLKECSRHSLRPNTISVKRLELSRFTIAMKNKGKRLHDITLQDLYDYVTPLQKAQNQVITTLRLFFGYLYQRGTIAENIAANLKRIRKALREKIISFYSEDEIAQIESSVDRRTKNGKRNYAMILLASRLGLRASDVVRIKFGDIDWDNSQITLRQYKTGRIITLPLLNDVGEAVIDYVLNARPETHGIESVFISSVRPYRECTSTSFSCMVGEVIRKSGVSTKGRHTGSHCLRHSLATALMNGGNEFPVISEVLGHSCSESTAFYLTVNIKSLLECSLDVPMVPNDFYTNKRRYFL